MSMTEVELEAALAVNEALHKKGAISKEIFEKARQMLLKRETSEPFQKKSMVINL